MKFCEKLQNLRKENNLSQEQLADMLEISRQSVSKWESGTTYPEMDKLIQLSKIFKCSLDDLTNDEIDVSIITEKEENKKSNLVDGILNIIRKTYNALRNMKLKDYICLFIELLILGLIFKLCFEPFSFFENGLSRVFYNFGDKAGSILTDLFSLLIEMSYVLLCTVAFMFIIKIRFLDRYGNKEVIVKKTNEEVTEVESEIEESKIITRKEAKREYNNAFFDTFSKIIIFFIKCFVVCSSMPLLFGLLFIVIGLFISISLLFSKVVYLGVIVSLIFTLVLGLFLLELIFDFIFNKRVQFKRMFITFIVGLVGLGVGAGLFAIDITNTTFIDDVPKSVKAKTETKEIAMNKDLYINDSLYFSRINYIEDNTINNIKIEYTYYDAFNDIYLINENNEIHFTSHPNENIVAFKDYKELIVKDLQKKEIHNYENLYEVIINIYGSKSNIELLQSNLKNRQEEISKENETENNYIDELSDKVQELQRENEELRNTNEEQKEKIEEYRSKLEDILDN